MVSQTEPSMPVPHRGWEFFVDEPGVGVAIVNVDGQVLYANRQAIDILLGPDFDPEQVQSRTLHDLFPSEFAEERIELMRRATETGRPVVIRHIARGAQVQSTLWPTGDDDQPNDQVLAVIRRGQYEVEGGTHAFEVVESQFVDLGPLEVLTRRELEVLALLGQGLAVPEIARMLHRSPKTIERHKTGILRKLKAKNWVELAKIAWHAGLQVEDARLKRI